MPDDNRAITPVQNGDIATMPIEQALEVYAPNFAAVLPPNIPVDHFKRIVVTALNINPALANADRRTLFNAAVKLASDGLLPDGREAALVVYKTKIKDRQGREHWIEAVQAMPMIAGIRKRLRNSGEVDSAIAEVVYRHDRFKYALGDQAFIEHEPPPLDQDRGEPVGAYAIIKLASGETIREVMSVKEIERVRAVSRAKDRGPWVDWWGEMARKVVLRRASKAAPQASVLEKLLMRDEEMDHLPAPEILPAIPPRPTREQFIQTAEPDPPLEVVDMTGTVGEYPTVELAVEAYYDALDEAEKQRGEAGLTTVWDNNQGLMRTLDERGFDELTKGMSSDYGTRRRVASEKVVVRETQQAAPPQNTDLSGEGAGERPGAGSPQAPRQGEPIADAASTAGQPAHDAADSGATVVEGGGQSGAPLPPASGTGKLGLGVPADAPQSDLLNTGASGAQETGAARTPAERRAARTHPFWHQKQSKRTLPEDRDTFLHDLPLRLAECID
jgi:recombination protein RecT